MLAASAAIAVTALWLLDAGPFEAEAPVDVAAISAAAAAADSSDPLAYDPDEQARFERDAAVGLEHVLFEKSPDGVVRSAERTTGYRSQIEAVAARYGTDPDLMEAMIFLESGGRSEVIAGTDPAAASGLTQIVASTGLDLLEMPIDLEASTHLSSRIFTAITRRSRLESGRADAPAKKMAELARQIGALRRLEAQLRAQRIEVDARFDPESALAGMGRYLEIAEQTFGRTDLAVQSYHMGIGNLTSVINRYLSPGDTSAPTADLVAANDLSYARIYFNSSPLRNPNTWALLSGFADESLNYYWKVLAAERILALYRDDRSELDRLIALHGAKATAEEVFHPEDETEVFDDSEAIIDAYRRGDLVPISGGDAAGFRLANQLGELADQLGVDRELYRGLRPQALATLAYISGQTGAISGNRGSLIVTSAVRDRRYQEALLAINPEATPEYSLHTTGWSFDILRRYDSTAQAQAFQFVLDRLRAYAIIDYAVEPTAIHITVSDRANRLR